MKRRIPYLLAVLICSFPLFAQTSDVSKTFDEAKSRLELLQKELWQVDIDERRDTEAHRSQSVQKGEFETTKQFEQRQQMIQEQANDIELRTLRKTGPLRDEIHRKMNEILSTEFSGDMAMALDRYDADRQRFGIVTDDTVVGYIAVSIADAPKFKADFPKGILSGRLGVLLDSENKAAGYLLSAQFRLNGKIYPVITDAFTQTSAMQMLFGNYDFETKASLWKAFTRSSDGEDRYELSTLKAEAILFKPFRENNVDKYLLVANTEPYKFDDGVGSCHACSGLPSIAVFSKNNGYWKIEMALKHGGEIGGYGSPGLPSLVRVGPEKFAVKFSWDNGRQAQVKGDYYWRIDGRFPREILNIYTYKDYDTDYEPKERSSFRTTTVFSPNSGGEFFDVKVTSAGKKTTLVGRRYVMTAFSKTGVYTFKDREYQLTKK